jgi:hypothetical protein
MSYSLQSINKRLQEWYRALPSCLSAGGSPPPHILSTHAIYHWAQIVDLQLLEKGESTLLTRKTGHVFQRQPTFGVGASCAKRHCYLLG